jgi:ribosomal protein S18 acetylase RimI-like enzyme
MPPPIEAAAAFGITYREMTSDDLPFVAALYATTRARELEPSGWTDEMKAAFCDQQHRVQHAQYRATYKNAEWLIVERDGVPVGRYYLDWNDEDGLLMIDLSLMPEQRGAGVGGAIFRDTIAMARAAGQPVTLHVDRFNPAIALYGRLGFRVEEEMPFHLRMVWREEDQEVAPPSHPGEGRDP